MLDIYFWSWLIALFVGGMIGSEKNRLLESLVICFFLSWIGVIIVALMRSRKVCPYCKRSIDKEATVCPYCQSKLDGKEEKS